MLPYGEESKEHGVCIVIGYPAYAGQGLREQDSHFGWPHRPPQGPTSFLEAAWNSQLFCCCDSQGLGLGGHCCWPNILVFNSSLLRPQASGESSP